MRILAVTTSFPRHDDDYAGRFVFDLHAGLREEGHEVVTVCPAAAGVPLEEATEAGRVVRVPYARSGAQDLFYGDGLEANWRPFRGHATKLRSFMVAARAQLLREQETRPADLILGHWLWPGARIAVLGAKAGVPVVGIGHGGDLHLLSRPLLGSILGRGLKGRLLGAMVTTEHGARVVRERLGIHPARVVIRGMGADPAIFAQSSGGVRLVRSRVVLGVGRLIPIKGFDVLLRAAASLQCSVVLAGDGPERRRLEQLVQEIGVTAHFLGGTNRRTVAELLQSAGVLAVPSRVQKNGRAEGFPVVVSEAALAKCPVVASAVGGMKDILPLANLVRPDDPEALACSLAAHLSGSRPLVLPFSPARRDAARDLVDLVRRSVRG